MSAAREKDQADFDLERFIDMFDEALTSKDPRVVNALRSLMMMVTLTRPESNDAGMLNRQRGPLRRLYEDIYHLNNRLGRIEEDHHRLVRQLAQSTESAKVWREAYQYDYPYEKHVMKEQAAMQLAAQIDQDVLAKLKAQGVMKAKGLLDK